MTTKDYCSINFTGLTHDHTLECGARNAEPAPAGDESELADESSHGYCSAIPILKQHPMYDCLVLVRKFRNCLGGYSLEFPVDRVREHERLPTNESAHHATAGESAASSASAPAADERRAAPVAAARCSQRRLVSRFLDGDDPVYARAHSLTSSVSQTSVAGAAGATGTPAASGHSEDAPATGAEQQVAPAGEEAEAAAAAAAAATAAAGLGADAEVDATAGNLAPASATQAGPTPAGEETDARLLFMAQIDDRGDQCHLVHVPINGLLDRLESYTRNGLAVDSRVYAFAMGLKTAERMMTTKSMKELHETPI